MQGQDQRAAGSTQAGSVGLGIVEASLQCICRLCRVMTAPLGRAKGRLAFMIVPSSWLQRKQWHISRTGDLQTAPWPDQLQAPNSSRTSFQNSLQGRHGSVCAKQAQLLDNSNSMRDGLTSLSGRPHQVQPSSRGSSWSCYRPGAGFRARQQVASLIGSRETCMELGF